MCWKYAYLILGLEDQYEINWHNNSKNISSVAIRFGMVDMYTL